MPLEPGTRFGAYEITGSLGAGGMGEVYRAHDTNLKRDVAIKVLPASLIGDSDRISRLQREAEVLASLNHPNIAHIYGLERVANRGDGGGDGAGDGELRSLSLIMELVDGVTLEEKLRSGALPVEDALRLALQIAEGLEAAHAKGVIHRDLKPANVMVTAGERVKVLDFGLAKALSTELEEATAANSPALSLAMTQAGLILGTAGYMSPEQASGQTADQRADIWAFGVVLYEMLTGLPLFSGESVPHILADVLKTEPDWNRLPKNLHPRLQLLLERCLRKRPRERYHSIADARIDVEDILSDPAGPTVPVAMQSGAAGSVPQRTAASRALGATGFLSIGGVLAGLVAWFLWPDPPVPEPKPVNRFAYTIPDDQVLQGSLLVGLSPDGRRFLYGTADGFYLRHLDDLEVRLIPETAPGRVQPMFSPDGQQIGFYRAATNSIWRIGIGGGASVLVADTGSDLSFGQPLGQSWHSSGTIFYSTLGGIYRVPATGGTPELVVASQEDRFDIEILTTPRLLPDGDSLLFGVAEAGSYASGQIVVQSLSSGEQNVLIEGGNDARYVPTGHIVYGYEDGLFGIAFDLESLTVSGGAVPLVQGVMAEPQLPFLQYDIANDGTLIYLRGDYNQARTIVWVDREGNEELVGVPPRGYVYVQLSPNGTRLALDSRDDDSDIWIYDLERATLQRLTFDSGINRVPLWSPDGERVLFSRALDDTEEVYWQAADGSGTPEALTDGSGEVVLPIDMTPDGESLLYMRNQLPRDILMVPAGQPEAEVTRLIATEANEQNAQVSPDGEWIAYESNESGETEVYVRPFPDVDSGRWQISNGGGEKPRWSRDGTELFYLVGNSGQFALMAVAVESDPVFRPSVPVQLFEGDYLAPNAARMSYDVSLDGERFLMIKRAEDEDAERPTIVIVQNWTEELKRLVPVE